MPSAFETLQQQLKQLPGLGFRSAERIALHLLVEKPERLPTLVAALEQAAKTVRRCVRCGHLSETELCVICADERRDPTLVCVVEHVPDLVALERSAAHRGVYHVLHGKLLPDQRRWTGKPTVDALIARVQAGDVREMILALSNDVEGEATCHYLTSHLPPDQSVKVSRIGFGLPSGGGVLYADSVTLKNALESRRSYS